jgi:rhodanese-related sulfurtransferase
MENQVGGRTVKLSPEQFIPLLEKVESGECILLDVRNPEEFMAERIEGAKNVPLDSIKINLEGLDRDRPLLIYCKVGKRCIKAVDQLTEMGFRDITVLDGGIESLKAHSRRR